MVDKEGLLQHFHDNPFLQINHMELVDAGEDWAQMELKVYEGSLNPLGLVHGGALFTLADSAGGAAAHTDGIVSKPTILLDGEKLEENGIYVDPESRKFCKALGVAGY